MAASAEERIAELIKPFRLKKKEVRLAMRGVNPQGVSVHSFKVPSREQSAVSR